MAEVMVCDPRPSETLQISLCPTETFQRLSWKRTEVLIQWPASTTVPRNEAILNLPAQLASM